MRCLKGSEDVVTGFFRRVCWVCSENVRKTGSFLCKRVSGAGNEGAEIVVESAITAGPNRVTVVAAHEDLFDIDSEHRMERTDKVRGLASIRELRGHARQRIHAPFVKGFPPGFDTQRRCSEVGRAS